MVVLCQVGVVLVGHSLGGLEARVYAQRWPEEVAGMFAYLASDEARYINGALFTIDGGMTC